MREWTHLKQKMPLSRLADESQLKQEMLIKNDKKLADESMGSADTGNASQQASRLEHGLS